MTGRPADRYGGRVTTDLRMEGVLGRTPFTLRRTAGRDVLRIGAHEMVIGPDTKVRHRAGLLSMTLTVEQPDGETFTHRYRLPSWTLQLAPVLDAAYDLTVAEADDPGLALTELLDGTSDWAATA